MFTSKDVSQLTIKMLRQADFAFVAVVGVDFVVGSILQIILPMEQGYCRTVLHFAAFVYLYSIQISLQPEVQRYYFRTDLQIVVV